MKPRPTIAYDLALDAFVLVTPPAMLRPSRAYVLSPEEAIDLRIDLRRAIWRRASEIQGDQGQ